MKTPTPTELNVAINKWLKIEQKYAVQKGSLYYRPNSSGYTASLSDCGQYTKAEGERELVSGEPMNLVPLPLPDYITGASARGNLNEAILRLDEEQRDEFMFWLSMHRSSDERLSSSEAFSLCFESNEYELATALVRVIKPEMFQ